MLLMRFFYTHRYAQQKSIEINSPIRKEKEFMFNIKYTTLIR